MTQVAVPIWLKNATKLPGTLLTILVPSCCLLVVVRYMLHVFKESPNDLECYHLGRGHAQTAELLLLAETLHDPNNKKSS